MDAYLKQNHFLPDINNEYQQKDDTYKANLASLKNLVLFRFEKDVTVVPLDSAWFSFFDGEKLLSMNETDLYLVSLQMAKGDTLAKCWFTQYFYELTIFELRSCNQPDMQCKKYGGWFSTL